MPTAQNDEATMSNMGRKLVIQTKQWTIYN